MRNRNIKTLIVSAVVAGCTIFAAGDALADRKGRDHDHKRGRGHEHHHVHHYKPHKPARVVYVPRNYHGYFQETRHYYTPVVASNSCGSFRVNPHGNATYGPYRGYWADCYPSGRSNNFVVNLIW